MMFLFSGLGDKAKALWFAIGFPILLQTEQLMHIS